MKSEQLAAAVNLKMKTAVNRLAVLPTEGNDGLDGGAPSDRTIGRYLRHAGGGAGIIFSEAVTIDYSGGRARKNQLCLNRGTAAGFSELVKTVKQKNPEVLFIIQLDHAGSLSGSSFSSVPAVYPKAGAELLSDEDIGKIRGMFAEGIKAAYSAGADGVDLKFSHGFFLNELIHPANMREGKYGGSFENRTRFLSELVDQVRKEVPLDEFLLGMRISAWEGIPGGCGTAGPGEVIEDLTETLDFVRLGEKLGMSFISVSAGNAAGNLEILLPNPANITPVYKHFGWQKAVKEASTLPVIGAGYTTLGSDTASIPGGGGKHPFLYWAEKNIAGGVTDIVGLGRQAIADASFPGKMLEGRTDEINFCKLCGGCGALLGANNNIGCVQYDDYYRELFKTIG